MDVQRGDKFPLNPGATETEEMDKEVHNKNDTKIIDVPNEPKSAEDDMDLSGISDPELKNRVRKMLESHK